MNYNIALIIFGAALATYCTRFPLLLYSGPKNIPPWLEKLLSFIAPTVLTALIVPMIFIRQGQVISTPANPYVLATIVCALTAYFSKNTIITVLAGELIVSLIVYL
jgi:branched-subunit amino acid transport protein